ncbi:HD domain-containing protein [Terrarubrum flagellatum]|uniref:HD domain-containing protein n=1 Tax=Terrirubrum flagellatum TaxID=2895980 RepID=UPI0031452B6D
MDLEERLEEFVRTRAGIDPAHDVLHTKRVVENAKRIGRQEGDFNLRVVLAACWLHDVMIPEKDSEIRASSSVHSAAVAAELLQGEGLLDVEEIEQVHHAIAAHSPFSGTAPETIEAKIVQDADRLDALGAVGIARCFVVGGRFGAALYNESEIIAEKRELDDKRYILDHFYSRLFRIEDAFLTMSGRREAAERAEYMRQFIARLTQEVG